MIGFIRIAALADISTSSTTAASLAALRSPVGVALVGVVLWGSVAGAMLPFLLRRCGLDPATSSAPFVATLVDVTGLLIYFNVALFVLRGTIL